LATLGAGGAPIPTPRDPEEAVRSGEPGAPREAERESAPREAARARGEPASLEEKRASGEAAAGGSGDSAGLERVREMRLPASPRCEGQRRHRPERHTEVAPREALGAGAHCVGVVEQDNRGGGAGEAEHELALRFARR